MDANVENTMADALAMVSGDIETAHGLPNPHYIDPDVYQTEKHKLFFETWAGIGFAGDVPDPGDAMPVDYLGIPLLLLRDRSNQIKVYQNICRHRGMILVTEPKNIQGAIRCPYHSWCYGLDGRLVSTPHVGGPGQNIHPSIVRDELSLVPVRSHVFRNVVLVNVDGKAPPFEEHAAKLMERWKDFDVPEYQPRDDSVFALDLACNWKLAVENFCESYHLPVDPSRPQRLFQA